jgi:hypothetical protein
MIATKLRVIPLVVLCACMENGLYPGENTPAKPGADPDSNAIPETDGDPIADRAHDLGDYDLHRPDADDGDGGDGGTDVPPPPARLSGTVTVLPTAKDGTGAVVELDWADVGDYPYGGIWVDAFTVGRGGKPRYVAQTALLDPTTGANPWSLDLPDGTVYLQAVLDEANDRIIGIAEPSTLWHERLEVRDGVVYGADGDPVEDLDLYVSVPTSLDDHAGAGGDDGGDGGGGGGGRPGGGEDGGEDADPGDVSVLIAGDATLGRAAGEDCAAMLFSANHYGPYYWSFYQLEDAAKPTWSMEVLANSGPMPLSTVCDANWNGLLDPADAWGAWMTGKGPRNPLQIGDRDQTDLRVQAPLAGAFTTAEPLVTLSGVVTDPMGFEGYPAGAVLYIVAQRGGGVADLAALDHEYAWTKVSDPAGRALPFALTVPAWKETTLWTWVDLDGDGVLNEVGEPGGASGPWYTDADHGALQITVRPAAG